MTSIGPGFSHGRAFRCCCGREGTLSGRFSIERSAVQLRHATPTFSEPSSLPDRCPGNASGICPRARPIGTVNAWHLAATTIWTGSTATTTAGPGTRRTRTGPCHGPRGNPRGGASHSVNRPRRPRSGHPPGRLPRPLPRVRRSPPPQPPLPPVAEAHPLQVGQAGKVGLVDRPPRAPADDRGSAAGACAISFDGWSCSCCCGSSS